MNNSRLHDLIKRAVADGILPKDAMLEDSTRPWPIVLMTGLGAWLAAIPLFVLMFLIFKGALLEYAWCYALGLLLMAAALAVLRNPALPVLVEQWSLPGLLVGGALIAYGCYRDMSYALAGTMITALGLATAWLVPQTWLRALLGALACATFMLAASEYRSYTVVQASWNGVHFALLAWLLALAFVEANPGERDANMVAVESIANGWMVSVLFAIVQISGATFVAGVLPGYELTHGLMSAIFDYPAQKTLSVLMTLAGAGWLAFRLPVLRAPRYFLAAAMFATLSWLGQTLGGALLVLAVCVVSGRWRLAVTSATAAVWVIGTFYYQLNITLTAKAIIMTAMGALFGVIAWREWRLNQASPATISTPSVMGKKNRWQRAGIAASLLATLLVVNTAIWQKEELIRVGRPVFLELAPADPRSLMQGDYMALNFTIPQLERTDRGIANHALVIAKIDARGIAVIQGIRERQALARNEILIELTSTNRGLRPASDAWYFKEGEAARWSKARYGEFRVDNQGHALLVGLRGANLKEL